MIWRKVSWRNSHRGSTWRAGLRTAGCWLLLACSGAAAAKAPESRPSDAGMAPALEHLLAGEFALQSGQFEQAAAHYEQASLATADAGIAERATRIALMANDLVQAERALARWQRLAPASRDPVGVALQLQLQRREVEPAQATARRLLGFADGWRLLLSLLSQPQADGGATARAALRAAAADPALPTDIEPGLAFAGLARRLGEAQIARAIVDRLDAARPDDARVLLAAAMLDREAGNAAQARQRLDRALALPLAGDLRRTAASELEALGDPAAGARVLAAGPQDDTTYMLRAAWLVDAGDKPGLAALDREIQSVELNPARRLLLGQIAEVRADWAAAERWYRSVESGPQFDRARLRVATALERQDKAAEGADWLRALQREGELDGDAQRDAYLLEAELWARQSDDPKAQDAFARGLAVFEDDPVLLYGRAMQHVRRERIDAGLADLRRILDRKPDHAEALNAYGYTLAEHTQRYAEALAYVEKSNRLQPGSAATLDSLGWIRHKLGDPHAALPLLREAWAREQDPEIAAHLGEVLWVTGARDEARAVWARGRELDPNNKALRQAQEKFEP
jgi:tetratricopeptide (TPR) repeat protein